MEHSSLHSLRSSKTISLHLYFAIGLMGLFALLHWQLFSQKPLSSLRVRLPDLPLQIGAWEGTDVRWDPKVVAGLGLDDWILRLYRHESGAFVWFYVGVLEHPGTWGHHSPQICYPVQGWELLHTGVQQIDFPGGQSISIEKMLVQKGLEKQAVLYWYQWGEKVVLERPPLWREYGFKLHAMLGTLTHARTDRALVRISAPVVDSIEATMSREVAFIQAAFPLLVQQFALYVSPP